MTHWEAQVLPRQSSTTSTSRAAPIGHGRDGQVRLPVRRPSRLGPVAKLSECLHWCRRRLSVIDVEKDREVLLREQGAVALRRSKLMRIAEEAREQGGVLTQEDLGVLLSCDERTIRRDIKHLRMQDIHVPTRGFVQDIGPTVSHKAQAIRHWLQGKEPVAVARAINHSLTAVERYLEDFKRVAFLGHPEDSTRPTLHEPPICRHRRGEDLPRDVPEAKNTPPSAIDFENLPP